MLSESIFSALVFSQFQGVVNGGVSTSAPRTGGARLKINVELIASCTLPPERSCQDPPRHRRDEAWLNPMGFRRSVA